MPTSPARDDAGGDAYVSAGHLPDPARVAALAAEAHARFTSNRDGENSNVYPALAQLPGDLFPVVVALHRGTELNARVLWR